MHQEGDASFYPGQQRDGVYTRGSGVAFRAVFEVHGDIIPVSYTHLAQGLTPIFRIFGMVLSREILLSSGSQQP